jgi:hypothetical protein
MGTSPLFVNNVVQKEKGGVSDVKSNSDAILWIVWGMEWGVRTITLQTGDAG